MKKYLLLLALLLPLLSCGQEGRTSRVVLGDEREELYLPVLQGNRVAILSNQTGIAGDILGGRPYRPEVSDSSAGVPFVSPDDTALGPHILDVLLGRGVNVTAIFSPEHGFRGTADAGEHVAGSVDSRTGVPILSLYGPGSNKPAKEDMDKFDILVVDIQDVGLRFYTYYITMQRLMDACGEAGKPVLILDRPNPNGFYVDGPILADSLRSGVGSLPIPVVHGMTLGELALMINGEGWNEHGCELSVIPCEGWDHRAKYSLLLAPSPNLKDMRAVYLYPSTCYFEGTVASLGRGTDKPFEMYGHPQLLSQPFSFTPASVPGAKNPPLLGQECWGKDLTDKPLEQIWQEQLTLFYVADALSALPDDFEGDFFAGGRFFDLLAGVSWLRPSLEESVRSGLSPSETAARLRASWAADVEAFKLLRRPYLLYAE